MKMRNRFTRLYNHPVSYFALLSLSYVVLLATSYGLGYLQGSSLKARHLSMVAPEHVRQTVIDRVYKGISPYEEFIPPSTFNSSLLQKRTNKWGSYGNIYERLIQEIRPNTIIELNGCGSATYMANLTRQIGLKTQILCSDDFHGRPGYRDLLMRKEVLESAIGSVLPVPISGIANFCEWGILGDLVEVDMGRDFYSAWSNINRAYKLLRPGGVIFGQNDGFRPEVKLFARVNKLRVTVEGEHWMINRLEEGSGQKIGAWKHFKAFSRLDRARLLEHDSKVRSSIRKENN